MNLMLKILFTYLFIFLIQSCSILEHKTFKKDIEICNFDSINNCTLIRLIKSKYKHKSKWSYVDRNCFSKLVEYLSQKTDTKPNAQIFNLNTYIYTSDSNFYNDVNIWSLQLCK